MTQPFNPHLSWHLQVINDQRDVAESDHAKLTRELEKVKGWGDQIAELVSALEDLSEYFEKYAASRPPGLGVSLPEQSLRELSDHFHDVCPKMSWRHWVRLAMLCLPQPACDVRSFTFWATVRVRGAVQCACMLIFCLALNNSWSALQAHQFEPEGTSLVLCLQDLQAKLCTSETQATVLKMLETQHTLMLRQLDEDRAVVELMWSHVSRPARDDPALHILPLLVAPLVQDRLEAMASDHTVGSFLLQQ